MRLTTVLCRFMRAAVENSMYSKCLMPPTSSRGLDELDRTLFDLEVELPALESPNGLIERIMTVASLYMFRLPNLKAIYPCSENRKKILLDPLLLKEAKRTVEDVRDKVLSVYQKSIDTTDITLCTERVLVTYENWPAEHIISAVLPEGNSVTGWSQIGHIIHLNLRDNLQQFGALIGTVLLDKVPNCRTVVSKQDAIDTVYRHFEFAVLAGDRDFNVQVKESKCRFEFDFSKVYWNPRLATEHERILSLLHPGDTLYDACAGIGPFAIPAALHRKCRVFANDLNPTCADSLRHNAKLNKVDLANLSVSCLDANEFMRKVMKTDYLTASTQSKCHLVMNLPALAVTFLPTLSGLLKTCDNLPDKLPDLHVHVYCFTKCSMPEAREDALRTVQANLWHVLEKHTTLVTEVRDVAPNKRMMRVSFVANVDLLTASAGEAGETPLKKHRTCLQQDS